MTTIPRREFVSNVENIYALCDVDDRQAARSFAAFPKAKPFKDFRVMLEKDGKHIDAVTVSTPDHTHALAGMMAMKLGKHSRIQKRWATSRAIRWTRRSGRSTWAIPPASSPSRPRCSARPRPRSPASPITSP